MNTGVEIDDKWKRIQTAMWVVLVLMTSVSLWFANRAIDSARAEGRQRFLGNCQAYNHIQETNIEFLVKLSKRGGTDPVRAAETMRIAAETFDLRDCDEELADYIRRG